MEQADAVQMFWKLPKLIGRLVSFLDLRSTLRLLQSHLMDKQILQKSFSTKAWIQLIRRSPLGEDGLLHGDGVEDLTKILKLMQLEEPSTFLLPLLDLICELSPDVSSPFQEHIVITCPCHTEPHIISTAAFLMLEEVEGAFGTAEQSIQSLAKVGCDVTWRARDPGWLAITSRMGRQREMVTSINDVRFYVNGHTTQVFATLMRAQEVSFEHLSFGFREKLGDEGWQVVAEAFRGNPNVVAKETCINKGELADMVREINMGVWDTTTGRFGVWGQWRLGSGFLEVDKSRYERDDARARLQQISEMTLDQFANEWRKEKGEDSEEGTESEGEVDAEDDREVDEEGDGEDEV